MAIRVYFFFFFNDTATTEIYTLSLHDALPIFYHDGQLDGRRTRIPVFLGRGPDEPPDADLRSFYERLMAIVRSEEHTSELQSLAYLVCRLLLEKKNTPQERLRPSPSVSAPLRH